MRSTRVTRRAAAIAVLAIAITGVGIVAAPAPAEAANTTYYVNNLSGSGCSDAGSGTSTSAPWCTFTPAASITFGAGDSLLLARGASWSQQLVVTLQGSATQVATLGAYGSGASPRILASGTSDTGVIVNDAKNAVVTSLDIGSKTVSGTSALSYGLMLVYTTIGNSNVTVTDISAHDNRIVGVFVRNTANTTNAQTALDKLTLSNITTTHNGHGIVVTNQGSVSGLPATATPGNTGSNVFTNVIVDRIVQNNDDNNNGDPAAVFSQIDAGCPDSLAISSASNVLIRNSYLNGSAGCRTGAGTAAIFIGNVNHVLIANNMVINTPNTANPDMAAIDHEATTNDVTIAGNYFADNFGGGIEYLAIHGANDFSTANTATGNVFIRNGVARLIPYIGGGAISQLGGGVVTSGTISDNIAFEPAGLINAHLGGSITSYTVTNNIPVAAATDISQSAAQFTAAPWGYQRGSGSTWTALTYNSGTASYTDSGVTIDRFTVTPAASTGAALSWTAPTSGVISLRAFPVAHSGTAAFTISRNGTTLATATPGVAGTAVKIDDLTVAAGDVIRFSVAAGASTVSLTPSVAYTSKTASTDPAGQWTFSVAGDGQGWTTSVTASVQRGYALLTTAAGTTTMDSPDGLHLATAASTAIRLSYQNNTSATSGKIYFTTATGQTFTAARSVAFTINPKTTDDIVEGFQNIIVPMSGNANWTGNIERIRIELTSAAGTFLVDSVQFTKPANPGWEFTTAASWTAKADVSCATTGVASSSPTLDLDNTGGTWATAADIIWNQTRMQQFTVTTPRLAQVDFWAYKSGTPAGCLYFRIIKITDSAKHRGETLFTGAVPASSVTTAGNFVSVYPGLTGLDTAATYAVEVFSPYVVPGGGTYGLAYTDDPTRPAAAMGELYSIDNNGTWNGPETNRSLRFRTYTATTIATQNPFAGYTALTVSGGLTTTTGGYEPSLLSPTSLAIAASSTRYVHIRMNNPDNRLAGYLLFTTSASPTFDQAGDGSPVANEVGAKGIIFSLVPGAGYHEYVLDMSTVPGWTGTIQRLMVEPGNRWSYRIGSLASTWSGKIDYIRLDSGVTAAAPGA